MTNDHGPGLGGMQQIQLTTLENVQIAFTVHQTMVESQTTRMIDTSNQLNELMIQG